VGVTGNLLAKPKNYGVSISSVIYRSLQGSGKRKVGPRRPVRGLEGFLIHVGVTPYHDMPLRIKTKPQSA